MKYAYLLYDCKKSLIILKKTESSFSVFPRCSPSGKNMDLSFVAIITNPVHTRTHTHTQMSFIALSHSSSLSHPSFLLFINLLDAVGWDVKSHLRIWEASCSHQLPRQVLFLSYAIFIQLSKAVFSELNFASWWGKFSWRSYFKMRGQ